MADLEVEVHDSVLRVVFNRPEARNAMTSDMYSGLLEACERADADPKIRAVSMRGAGGKAFVAGTDIAQFRGFTGEDGIAYEQTIADTLSRLAMMRKPLLAFIDGHCVGGGLGLAACADIRVGNPRASFAVPIARTLGNTLNTTTLDVIVRGFGESRVRSMLIGARAVRAEEALACGFLTEVDENLDELQDEYEHRISHLAPLTQWSVKENLRRLKAAQTSASESAEPNDSDVVSAVYGSDDFAHAVEAFLTKQSYEWSGR
jgi:enoyl-CoA hydratase/carnithine racemase